MTGNSNSTWHLLIYKVPSEPSRKRIYVWRELKKLGGLYLQQAVCIFPDVPGIREQLETIKEKIGEFEGEALLLKGIPMDQTQEKKVIQRFADLRDEEYKEITDALHKFIAEIEKEIKVENFTIEELEEEEAELEKIKQWYRRAKERDWFGAPSRTRVEEMISVAETVLADFTGRIYRTIAEREQQLDGV